MSSNTERPQDGPVLRRRRLGNELRRLREEAGITINEVASHLYCSPSKISRMETARVSANIRDVRDMLLLYRVDDSEREILIQLALDARRRESWWHAHGNAPEPNVREFIDLEAAASLICVWEILLIPGLLQVPEYARLIISEQFPDRPMLEVERIVRLRPLRQSILRRNDPPELRAVFDEAALEHLLGMSGLVRGQLQRLKDTARLPNVSIRVIPSSTGPHAGMTGAFTILGYPDAADLDLVHFEHLAGDLYVDRSDQVNHYKQLFERLEARALTHDETVALLSGILRELGGRS